jgi:hypothetical protein
LGGAFGGALALESMSCYVFPNHEDGVDCNACFTFGSVGPRTTTGSSTLIGASAFFFHVVEFFFDVDFFFFIFAVAAFLEYCFTQTLMGMSLSLQSLQSLNSIFFSSAGTKSSSESAPSHVNNLFESISNVGAAVLFPSLLLSLRASALAASTAAFSHLPSFPCTEF